MTGRNRPRRNAVQRYARLAEIERMDLQSEYSRIWWLDMAYEFPWEFSVGGALAFLNSVAPPHMAALLVRTGELTENTRRRMEHFALISTEMVRRGFKDERGKAAVRQMNRIHKSAVKHISNEHEQWSISNDEYLFVLATSMLTQARWVDQHGWRKLSDREKASAYLHMREQGQHMGLRTYPAPTRTSPLPRLLCRGTLHLLARGGDPLGRPATHRDQPLHRLASAAPQAAGRQDCQGCPAGPADSRTAYRLRRLRALPPAATGR